MSQAKAAVVHGVTELGEPRVERGSVLRLNQIVDLERGSDGADGAAQQRVPAALDRHGQRGAVVVLTTMRGGQ
ncbi:hypothetical protein [Micromonospora sp. CPCC 206061]|uniref:hypothetical protein n=1 Tax=Micromonospora sp. CPCC 206061 TaxID=3122410 RepID=UPI002FEEA46E